MNAQTTHVLWMTALWACTSAYGGLIIQRAVGARLARLRILISLQPEQAVELSRQGRLLVVAGILGVLTWSTLLALTSLAFMLQTPAMCQLYLC